MRTALFPLLAFALLSQSAAAEAFKSPARHASAAAAEPTRIMVQRRLDQRHPSDEIASAVALAAPQLKRIQRSNQTNLEIWAAEGKLDDETTQRILRSLQSRNDVEFASVAQRRHAHSLPSDVLFPNQWYLQHSQPAAIAANTAWDLTTGSAAVVVAVLDTGIRFDHPDLAGKVLPGYDFVSGETNGGFLTANDGDGWDADASDPGDWIDSSDKAKPIFSDCDISNSSWHGTRVAGMIGASTDNAIGIAAAGYRTMILPVRVLGKCGGYDDDIIAGMRWAAGIHVSDSVPDNPNPAKIINLSLGGSGVCSAAYQSTIQQLIAKGVVIVVSAGNEGGPVDEPANCPGVIGVAGLRHVGTKVGYSSLGPEVSIAAPAGNCFNLSGACLYSLDTTYNTGLTVPAASSYTDQFHTNLGTSFSAPQVAAVAALMRATNSQLTSSQVRTRLIEGASAFPAPDTGISLCHVPNGSSDIQNTECGCTTSTCGAGMLNAHNAVVAAQRPIINLNLPTSVSPNASITLDASASTASVSRSIASYVWSVVTACNVTAPTLTTSTQSSLIVNAPAAGSYTLRLTIADSQGATDTADITVTTSSAGIASAPTCVAPPPVAPSSVLAAPESSSSGGGTLSLYFLLSLLIIAMWMRRYRRSI